ncbi:hypothetical protein KC19_10G133900 [Ceratodon purpureus]|uniref:Uncharacterized protein n=1 Tax=Ceratodon purpureus TaxID=3225 RepID=A0A8T0GNN0_CERPU|nr:hypothetical protein KC19_10G133900 [Ceratodon purpureus]
MSYHELTRKELQALCKQNGLPANKSNVVMASSLESFFSEQQTLTQAYAQFGTPCTVTKSVKARAVPKLERLETSLASLILGSVQPSAKGGQDSLLKKCKEPGAISAFLVSSPADNGDSILLPKTTPLRRRRKKSDAVKALPICAEDAISRDVAQVPADSTENLRLLPEETSVHTNTSQIVVKKISTPEPQLAPHFNADVLVTDTQGSPRTRGLEHQEDVASTTGVELVVKREVLSPSGSEPVASSSAHDQDYQNMFNAGCSQPVLMSPLLRITANVDTLILRATGMLEKFEQWKTGSPNKDFVHCSGQKHLSFDKENLHQQSPCKNSKLRSLQGCMGTNAAQQDRKENILKDIVPNAQT